MPTCNNCGWVHFEVTRAYAEDESKRFNEYYDKLPKEKQERFAGRSSIESYEHCTVCNGSYKNFRESKPGDCPDGCTQSPIIRSDE